jgi:hypothetical protein
MEKPQSTTVAPGGELEPYEQIDSLEIGAGESA